MSTSKKPKLSDDWPKVLSGNRVVWKSDKHVVDADISRIQLNGRECKISTFRDCKWEIHFSTAGTTFELLAQDMTVKDPDIQHFCLRATKLCVHCQLLNTKEPAEITQVVRDGTVLEELQPDSDDEQIPDPPLPKSFSDVELCVLNSKYVLLWDAFKLAKKKCFQNQAGKNFFSNLGLYLMSVQTLPENSYQNLQFRSYHSTNPKGDAQPGACNIIMADKKRHDTRQSQEGTTDYRLNMVADYVLYDTHKNLCCVVGEIKGEEEDAEEQNLLQMFASFRENQTAMLGFTANKAYIVPRLLLRSESSLSLYILTQLNLSNPRCICELAQLFTLVMCTTISEPPSLVEM